MRSITSFLVGALLCSWVAAGCGGTPDGPAPDAAVPGTLPIGAICTNHGECASGICIDVGPHSVCTARCDGRTDCPTASNWGCIHAEGFSPTVCGCNATGSTERCGNGVDDDCSGRADDCRICDGRSVPNDDPNNCGSCGNVCGPDATCTDGACVCPSGSARCGGRCVVLASDESHCGTCGNACGIGVSCVRGGCGCPIVGDSVCDETCANLNRDPAHCGTCTTECSSGQTCSGGRCACPSGSSDCGAGCIDTSSDRTNCGACGSRCLAAEMCLDSICRCPAGQMRCGTACVNTSVDTRNCGGCGLFCPSGATCAGGTCDCPGTGTFCSGACVSTATSTTNCGACSNVCPALSTCVAGTCTCSGGRRLCGGSCVDPTSDGYNCGGCGVVCPAGQACNGGTCDCAGATETYCPLSFSCADLTTNPQNCGACGNVCPGWDTSCRAGACVCTTPGLTNCGAGCVDLTSDEVSCGTCGTPCAIGATCLSGGCYCAGTQVACGGRCVDRATDVANCGACGVVCPTTASCSGSACVCPYYIPDTCGGACVDRNNDEANCGACGRVCAAGGVCVSGACTCPTETPDLCGGTCVNLQSDETNCGSCGTACADICSAGACERIVGLAAGGGSGRTCALLAGSVQCWGVPSPSRPTFLEWSAVSYVDFSIGESSNCYVASTGAAACWGDNSVGQLGDGTTSSSTTPRIVSLYSDYVSIAASGTTCGVHADGQVSCWGTNIAGALGGGSSDPAAHATPARVPGVSAAVAVAVGTAHVCARRTDGTVSCWGSNSYGQLGRGAPSSGASAPMNVPLPAAATRVFAQAYSTCALLADATLSCWGQNDYGVLGDGTRTTRGTPLVVPGLTGVVSAAMGDYNVCAARTDGTVRCWGRGVYRALDGTSTSDQVWATNGPTLPAAALEVSVGISASCARLADASVFCWGTNSSGELGDGTLEYRYGPTRVIF